MVTGTVSFRLVLGVSVLGLEQETNATPIKIKISAPEKEGNFIQENLEAARKIFIHLLNVGISSGNVNERLKFSDEGNS